MRRAVILAAYALMHLCTYALSYAQDNKKADQEVDGFSLSQYEKGGEKKWELNGKSAQVEDNNVRIDEVSAKAFGEDVTLKLKAREGNFDRVESLVRLENNVVVKTTDGTGLTTDSLVWNAETKNVSSEALVNIKKADFEVSGTGADVDLENKTAELKKDVTANITSLAPGYLQTTNHPSTSLGTGKSLTTITCDGPLEINYKKNRAIFRNNVRVKDREGDVFADRIDVYFNPATRRIKCVVAQGNVRIVNGENVTYSEKAIYLVDEGRIVLPQRPRLVIQGGTADKF